jgi:hypothetical protein
VQSSVIEGELEFWTNLSNRLAQSHQVKRSHTVLTSIMGKDPYSDSRDVSGVLGLEGEGD